MSSTFEELISRFFYPIIIGVCLLIIVIYIIYYCIRSIKVDKHYKKYKDKQNMTQIHQSISLPSHIKCPLCQEMISSDVSFCPQCGKDIRNMEFQPIPMEINIEQLQNTSRTFCNKCGKQLLGHPNFCSNCGNKL